MTGNASPLPTALGLRPAAGLVETRAAIAAGTLTPAAAIDECRRRIERGNEALKAFTIVNDEPYTEDDPSLPLAGIAIGIKDLYDTAGLETSYGSPIYKHHVPVRDAKLVALLKTLGGHVAGKTVTTEFAWRQAGPTVNPWNSAHTPGGSSSGSAAAVAAGMVPLAIGTQTFGSVIRPAAYCGVVGFKPTHGMLPLDGAHPLSPTLDHAGFFARSAQDIAHVFQHFAPKSDLAAGDPRSLRVRFVHGPGWAEATATQTAVLERAHAGMRQAGITVEASPLPRRFDEAQGIAEAILCYEAARIFQPVRAQHPGRLSNHIEELVRQGELLGGSRYQEALLARRDLQAEFEREMQDFDAILTLPALGEAPLLTAGTGNPAPSVPWTLLGVPAITLPLGFGTDNLPLGLQLVGKTSQDRLLLSLATWVADNGGASSAS